MAIHEVTGMEYFPLRSPGLDSWDRVALSESYTGSHLGLGLSHSLVIPGSVRICKLLLQTATGEQWARRTHASGPP
jgi:hypothetical protein